jgi:hypothetical protein
MNVLLASLAGPIIAAMLQVHTNDTPSASFEVGVYPVQRSSKLHVAVAKHHQKRLNLRLVNPKNEVLYQETVGKHQAKYQRKLDLSTLPDGVYQLQITDGQDTVVREVSLGTTKPEPVQSERFVSLR